MRRSKPHAKTKDKPLKAIPWAALLRGGVVVTRRWKSLSAKDRARLSSLLRESGGRPGNLALKQRKELRALVGKLDLGRLGRELLPLVRGGRRGRRCRRCKSA